MSYYRKAKEMSNCQLVVLLVLLVFQQLIFTQKGSKVKNACAINASCSFQFLQSSCLNWFNVHILKHLFGAKSSESEITFIFLRTLIMEKEFNQITDPNTWSKPSGYKETEGKTELLREWQLFVQISIIVKGRFCSLGTKLLYVIYVNHSCSVEAMAMACVMYYLSW